ncbi:kinase-like domain-containing protein [Colletotrichum godetiae]|uniref:Kinase-like domain-containing protein n=1 Tax=Colletotrichum godetiae TaxID=1209918 RepID=A0AAJ0AM72_9PEZI|nr:kinase-like domain-containing protein [Colletotrichum godetiae]KAK1674266.1 kinase-like domain-containing protein [Colletotrichum godetiae]
MGETKPINAGRLVRVLTLLVVWTKTNKYFKHIWKPQIGLPAVFGICIKVKPYASLAEAHTMQFVAQHTSVPVPKVYSAFVHRGMTYIVMSKIDGKMAWMGWEKRSEASKKQILNQLCGMVSQLRAIAPTEGLGIANIDGGPIYDCRLPFKSFWGPFAAVQDFHKELANGADFEVRYENQPPDLQELLHFYRRLDEDLAFTHGDLSSFNVLVKGDDVVGIVDWETAGWLPSYWEYTSAWFVSPQNPFWQQEVDKFLTPMPYELRMESIRRNYFGAT